MDGNAYPDLDADLPLPPAQQPWRLLLVLRMCRRADRMDALGEAWVAALAGEDPATAVDRFRKRESRHRTRCATGVDLDPASRVVASPPRRPRRRIDK